MDIIEHETQEQARQAALAEEGDDRHVVNRGGTRLVFLPGRADPIVAPAIDLVPAADAPAGGVS